MVEDSTSDDNTTTNKGVNARSDSLPVVHKSGSAIAKRPAPWNPDTETSVSSGSSLLHGRSITDIKNDIQNALDLMGPSTPTFTPQNTSSEADNEEESSSLSTVKKPKSYRKSLSFSETTSLPLSSVKTGTDFDSLAVEHVCCEHVCTCPEPPLVEEKCLNTQCMMGYVNQASVPVRVYEGGCRPSEACVSASKSECRRKGLFDWLKTRSIELVMSKKSQTNPPCELYKINICGREDDRACPKRVVFDLVDGIPKPCSSNVATNTIGSPVQNCSTVMATCDCKIAKNSRNQSLQGHGQKHESRDSDGDARVDYYYFDHGNARFFQTTDVPPVMAIEVIAEKTEKYTTKFWAEIFATVHIGFSFCISFVLQLFKFLLYGVIRPLTVGLMQLSSDYFFKPFLTTLFNGIVQPCLIFFYNVATSLRDLCDPIAEAGGFFCKELAVVFRAIRLCTYKKNVDDSCECRANPCDKKSKHVC